MVRQLNAQLLPELDPHTVAVPSYQRGSVSVGIVHLGLGGFHRAHQAVYTDDVLAAGDLRWGITGASLRSTSVRDRLAPQDTLYTVSSRDGEQSSNRVIGSVLDVLALPEPGHLDKLCGLIALSSTHVVTLTITEKGYCADHAGELDLSHPDIAHDLANPNTPISAPGVLALGLRRRMAAKGGPLTVLSCDNVSGNGVVTANVVRALLAETTPDTLAWLDDQVSFPSSMVDRIVPSVSDAEIERFADAVGYRDDGLLTPEPFSQWVIEDAFAGAHPAWNDVGAQLVSDVRPFEQAKLRLLNATHSALAYLGLLAGCDTVHDALAQPGIASFARAMLDDEITPALDCPAGFDIEAYKASLLARFANTAVPYATRQVASDGSQKLPQRILPSLQTRLEQGQSARHLATVVAAWLRCLQRPPGGAPINDPQAASITELAQRIADPSELVRAIGQQTDQFGTLAGNPAFETAVSEALGKL